MCIAPLNPPFLPFCPPPPPPNPTQTIFIDVSSLPPGVRPFEKKDIKDIVTQGTPPGVALGLVFSSPDKGLKISGRSGVPIEIPVLISALQAVTGGAKLLEQIQGFFKRRSLAGMDGASFGRRQAAATTTTTPNGKVEANYWVVMHELNGTGTAQTWVPTGPTGATLDGGDKIRFVVLVNTLNTIVPMVRKGLPCPKKVAGSQECEEFERYLTTSGNEVYITTIVAAFLVLFSVVIVLLPCCMSETTKPPLPAPVVEQAQPPAPVVVSPPPPAPAPVFVREVEPQMRYNVQGAPIKHFGPPIGGSGWKPAPQTEYSVPISTSPDTEGQLGFSDGYAPGAVSAS